MSKSSSGYPSFSKPSPFFIPLIPTLPSTTPIGQIYLQTSDSQVYFSDGTQWKKYLGGPIGTSDIADGAVTNPKIANNAIDTTKIQSGSVTNAQLATASANGVANSVVVYQGDGNIVTNTTVQQCAKFQSQSTSGVSFVPVGNSSVPSKNLYIGWDQTNNWGEIGQFTTNWIMRITPSLACFNAFVGAAAGSIPVIYAPTGQLVPNLILNSNIDPSAAIAYSKLNLSNSIVAGDITSGAITNAKLGTAAVQNVNIGNGQVDPIKTSFMDGIASVNADGTIGYSYGISGVTHTANSGVYVVNFNNTATQRTVNVSINTGTTTAIANVNLTSSSSVTVNIVNLSGTAIDKPFFLHSLVFT